MKPLAAIKRQFSACFFSFILFASFISAGYGQGTIFVEGTLPNNTNWSADTVKVTGDLIVGHLIIQPGTIIEFQGYYKMSVGSLEAVGAAGDTIVFTINDTTGIYNSVDNTGGWGGIVLTGGSSLFSYCKIEYVKNLDFYSSTIFSESQLKIDFLNCVITNNHTGGVLGEFEQLNFYRCKISNNKGTGIDNSFGGILKLKECILKNNLGIGIRSGFASRIFVENSIIELNGSGIITSEIYYCQIKNNLIQYNRSVGLYIQADIPAVKGIVENNIIRHNFGPGLSTEFCGSVLIRNNLIYGNEGYGIEQDEVSPTLINNTIINNAGGIMTPIGVRLYNSIIRDNGSMGSITVLNSGYNPFSKIYNCNIEGVTAGDLEGEFADNIDLDPLFINAANYDFHLSDYSPCINAGMADTTGMHLPLNDLDGNPRIHDGRIDMGAFEYQQDNFHILKQPENNTVCEGTVTTIETEAIGGVTGYQWQKNGSDLPGANQALLNFDPVSTTDSGYYSCIITADDQIVSTDTILLRVDAIFVLSDQSASFSMCPGKDTLLYVSTLGNKTVDYAWYKNDVLLPASKDSILTIPFLVDQQQDTYHCVLSNSCKSETSPDMEIIIHDTPELELSDNLLISAGETLQIDAGSEWQSYTWNTGSENQVLTVPGLASGTYTYNVAVTDQNNCPAYDTVHVTVAVANGIPETSGMGITIYPNPVNDLLYLNTAVSVEEEVNITFSDNSGKIVLMAKYDKLRVGATYPIDVSVLGAGEYYLKISNRKMNWVEKIVIE